MLKVGPAEDGDALVDAMAMTMLSSSSVISLLKIPSISVQSCGLFGTCDMQYQWLSSAALDVLSEIFDNVD